jgi:hypothetical protein
MQAPHRAALSIILGVLFASSQAWAFEICLNPRLEGYFYPLVRAEKVLPTATRAENDVVVYIEKNTDGKYYVQSNFVAQGSENPTKLAGGSEMENFLGAYSFILHPRQEHVLYDASLKASAGKAKIILDKSVFDENGQTPINLDTFKDVQVVGRDGEHPKLAMRVDTRDSPPPVFVEALDGCCLFVPMSYTSETVLRTLRGMRLQSDDIVFVSLVRDSATDAAISKSVLGASAASQRGGEIISEPQLLRIFRQARSSRKTVVLLGHTEGGAYVTTGGAPKKTLFSIDIDRVRSLARDEGVSLIDFGCNTAQEVRAASGFNAPASVLQRINSVNAVHQLAGALTSAQNYEDFFKGLVSPALKIVLGQTNDLDIVSSRRGIVFDGQMILAAAQPVGIGIIGATIPSASIAMSGTSPPDALENQPRPTTNDPPFPVIVQYFLDKETDK